MKVIAKTRDGYMLEASEDDIAYLIGYNGRYSVSYDKSKLQIGDKINISAMYGQLYNLKENQPKLKNTVNILRSLADLLEPVCPVIEASLKEAAKDKEAKA